MHGFIISKQIGILRCEEILVEEKLEVIIGKQLRRRGMRIAVAESCTGGLVGHRITNIAGSSDYFLGGVMAYANEIKERLLGVRRDTLMQHGAVSRETVIEMAAGVRRLVAPGPDHQLTIGLSISGIAGPGGATEQKPVGLVWIGLSTPDGDWAWEHHLDGERVEIKAQAAEEALQHLKEYLIENPLRPVQVEIRSAASGDPTPLSFTWQGRSFPINDWGRRWRDETGLHILVMAHAGNSFELVQAADGAWFLNTTSLPPSYV
jgi:nicotinamide-nucleotide amidase